jgi:hypothetical protein
MSVRLFAHAYGAKPTAATVIPLTVVVVITPGGPVYLMPAPVSVAFVCSSPAAPKSRAWLLARFIRSKPASVSART